MHGKTLLAIFGVISLLFGLSIVYELLQFNNIMNGTIVIVTGILMILLAWKIKK